MIDELGLKVYCCRDTLDRPIIGGYSGDLLSDVMAHSHAGEIWITIQTHPNIIAVASLKELGAILLANGRAPLPETLEKAEMERISVLGSPLPAFELAARLSRLF
ncbi:MAG: serine kinase [Candidatus Zixiibacteriota bacterium]|nr:MAG: serine kinase [candidate division Zixibacteria bacterium]